MKREIRRRAIAAYATEHAMNLPEIAADRAAFLLKELGVSPKAPAPVK